MLVIKAEQEELIFEEDASPESKGCGKGVGSTGADSGIVGTPVLLVDTADSDATGDAEDVDEGKITDDPTTAVAVRVATFATALAVFCLRRCGS